MHHHIEGEAHRRLKIPDFQSGVGIKLIIQFKHRCALTDIHVLLRVERKNCGDQMTFNLGPSSDQHFVWPVIIWFMIKSLLNLLHHPQPQLDFAFNASYENINM